jgi:hypothetical protein
MHFDQLQRRSSLRCAILARAQQAAMPCAMTKWRIGRSVQSVKGAREAAMMRRHLRGEEGNVPVTCDIVHAPRGFTALSALFGAMALFTCTVENSEALEVSISVTVEGQRMPTVVGVTNLPDDSLRLLPSSSGGHASALPHLQPAKLRSIPSSLPPCAVQMA